MQNKLKILSNHVLILPDEQSDTVTKSGILIPNKLPKEALGTIIGVGEQPDDELLKVGARVMFHKLGSVKLTIDGIEHYLCKVGQFYGIVEDEKSNNY